MDEGEGGRRGGREGGTYFTRSNTSFQKYKLEITKALLVEKTETPLNPSIGKATERRQDRCSQI